MTRVIRHIYYANSHAEALSRLKPSAEASPAEPEVEVEVEVEVMCERVPA